MKTAAISTKRRTIVAASRGNKRQMALSRRNTLVGLSFILPNFVGFYFCVDPGIFLTGVERSRVGRFQPHEIRGIGQL